MIVGAVIVPSAVVLVPEVGRGRERAAVRTVAALRQAARFVATCAPDTLLLLVPMEATALTDTASHPPQRSPARPTDVSTRMPSPDTATISDRDVTDLSPVTADRGQMGGGSAHPDAPDTAARGQVLTAAHALTRAFHAYDAPELVRTDPLNLRLSRALLATMPTSWHERSTSQLPTAALAPLAFLSAQADLPVTVALVPPEWLPPRQSPDSVGNADAVQPISGVTSGASERAAASSGARLQPRHDPRKRSQPAGSAGIPSHGHAPSDEALPSAPINRRSDHADAATARTAVAAGIRQAVELTGDRVLVVACGELASDLYTRTSRGFNAAAAEFDRQIVTALQTQTLAAAAAIVTSPSPADAIAQPSGATSVDNGAPHLAPDYTTARIVRQPVTDPRQAEHEGSSATAQLGAGWALPATLGRSPSEPSPSLPTSVPAAARYGASIGVILALLSDICAHDAAVEVLSYEAPFGTGYLVATVQPSVSQAAASQATQQGDNSQ